MIRDKFSNQGVFFMIRTLLKPLSFIPAILLMMMIYRFSAQPAEVSSQLSYKVSYKIVETADYLFDTNLDYWQMDEWANRIHGVTRKLAHMTEYFALAVAVSFPLYVYGVHGIWLMLLAGMICVGFAAGDESHQSFVSGRSPSVKDIGIDSFGVFWGIILVRIIGWTGRKTIFRPKKKKVKTKKINKNNKNYQYDYEGNEELPPYYPGENYPPYQEAPRYYQPQQSYDRSPKYQRRPEYPPYPEQPPYQGQSPYQSQPPYSGHPPYPNESSYDDYASSPMEEDVNYENNPSDEKEPFFMKSAYDGKPKPYDPKDPFQDWMDYYFPEKDDSTK